MKLDQVYAKTREGEEAVHQRTRLVQRNLRTVLIVIDGKTSVGDLIEKVGSEEVLFGALEQLERDGFIRPLGGESTKSGDSDSMANYLEPATDETFPSIPVSAPAKGPITASVSGDASINPFAPAPVTATVRSASTGIDAVSISPFSVSSALPPAGAAPANPFQAAANPFGSSSTGSSPFGTPAPKPVPPPVAEPVAAPEQLVIEPVVSKPFKPAIQLFTGKRLGIGALVLLFVVMLVAVFYPYDSYRPRIEAALSEMAGQPVKITSVSASFSPAPTLVISQLSIGMDTEGGAVSVAEVRAIPTLGSLFGSRKSFSRVTLRGAQVPMAQLGLVATALGAAGKNPQFHVAKVDVDRMTLSLRDIAFQDYSGHAELAAEGGLRQMELRSKDGTMTVLVGPGASEKDPTQVVIQGQGWKSAEGSPFVFDSLIINGQLSGTRFAAEKIEGRILGGVIQGQLNLDWSSGMLLAGDVNVDYMNAPQLSAALGSGSITVEGQASARFRFRATGESWSTIAGKIPLEGNLMAKTGVINGLDLVEAVRRGSKLATRGGATRYEQLVGKFRWDGSTLQLSELDLNSGVMRATGSVGIVRGGQINGSLTVALQSSAATMRSPVAIVGTLKDPQLFGGRN